MKSTQTGSTLVVYLLWATVILAAVYGIYYSIDHQWETTAGIRRGEANVQGKWDAANKKAADDETARAKSEQAILAAEQAARAKAETEAKDYQRKWMEARHAADKAGISLANCAGSKVRTEGGKIAAQPTTTLLEPAKETGGVLLTWQFVGLYDSAWTNPAGQPLYGNPAAILQRSGATDPAASSPYGPGEVIDNHQANAVRHSQCIADFTAMRAVVKRLADDWDRRFAVK